jgi:hypothetical protein
MQEILSRLMDANSFSRLALSRLMEARWLRSLALRAA